MTYDVLKHIERIEQYISFIKLDRILVELIVFSFPFPVIGVDPPLTPPVLPKRVRARHHV